MKAAQNNKNGQSDIQISLSQTYGSNSQLYHKLMAVTPSFITNLW
jgi:hypothetical protein